MIRKRVINGLDFRVCEKLFIRAISFGDAQLLGGFLSFAQFARRDGRDFAPFALLHRRNHFFHRNGSYSQHAPFNFLSAHAVSLVFDT